jgi:hypothetical protein
MTSHLRVLCDGLLFQVLEPVQHVINVVACAPLKGLLDELKLTDLLELFAIKGCPAILERDQQSCRHM